MDQQVLLPSEISSLVMKCLHTFPGTLLEVSQQLVDESHEKARTSDKWDNKSMQEFARILNILPESWVSGLAKCSSSKF